MTTDNLLLLPVEILVLIFKKLKYPDLRNVMLTCKTLKDLIQNDNRIWRAFSEASVILQDSADNRWFGVFSWYDRCRISHNWHCGCYKSKTVVYHYLNYMPWLKFHNSEVLLMCAGSELFCYRTDKKGMPLCANSQWKIDVPKILRHDVRTNDISRFVLKSDLLVCGNRDGCVAVYKLNNIHKRPKLQCHIKDCHDNGEVEVSAVELIDSRDQITVVTCSSVSPDLMMCTFKNRDKITPGNHDLIYIPLRDCAGAKCLSLNSMSDKLALGLNGNSQPMLLDVNSAQFLLTAETTVHQRQAIRDIRWHDHNTIVYVTHSGFLQLLDTRSHKVVYKARDPFQSSLYCVKTDGENAIVVGSAEYSRCVLFDVRKVKSHVQMYFTQRNVSPVYSLDFDSTKLITAVDRGAAVLNFNIAFGTQTSRDYSRHVFQ